MKAILVIDMPSNCAECPLCDYEYYDCKGKTDVKPKVWVSDERQPWCPLKPMPKVMPYEQTDTQTVKAVKIDNGFRLGWNACLKEIEK